MDKISYPAGGARQTYSVTPLSSTPEMMRMTRVATLGFAKPAGAGGRTSKRAGARKSMKLEEQATYIQVLLEGER